MFRNRALTGVRRGVVLLAALLCLEGGPGLAQAPVSPPRAAAPAAPPLQTVTVAEARVHGLEAIRAGDFAGALGIADALRAHDAADPFAPYLASVALLRLGQPAQAEPAARLAYRLGTTPEQRFQAARTTAMAAYNQQKFGMAQRWLRRAALHAPTDPQMEQTRAEFGAVAGKNPISVNFRLSVTPSDNVNNGSSDRFNIIDGVPYVGVLSEDAQALSGTVGELAAGLGYRLGETAAGATRLSGNVYLRRVRLSDTARAATAGLGETDYDSDRVEGALQHFWQRGPSSLTATGTVGRQWSGTSDPYSYGRLAFGHRARLGDAALLETTATVEQRTALPGRDGGDRVLALHTGLTRALTHGDRASLALYASRFETDQAGRSSNTLGGALTYALGRPVGPVLLSGTLGYRVSDYPGYTLASIVVPGGRQDQTLSAGITMTFHALEVGGFAPTLSLQSQRTRSNVSRFEATETGVTIGLRSTF